jgi:hypothetical protein
VSAESLAVYLNDHLAGSVAALELLDALAGRVHGTPAEQMLRTVRVEVTADQDVLRAVLDKVGGDESRLKQAAAWLSAGSAGPGAIPSGRAGQAERRPRGARG